MTIIFVLEPEKGELPEDERLLRLKELAAGYHVETGIGLTHTFGSIYNNIVNSRFGDSVVIRTCQD